MPRKTPEDMVRQNILCCMSHIIATLAQGAAGIDQHAWKKDSERGAAVHALSDMAEQAMMLCAPVEDCEEAARQAGWQDGSGTGKGKYFHRDNAMEVGGAQNWQELCKTYSIAPYEWEIFEHWAVTDWLAEKLEEKGERVDRDFGGLAIWGRTCTGQAIYCDYVICRIFDEMMRA